LKVGKKLVITEILLLAAGAVVGALLRYKLVESPMMLGSLQINVLIVNVLGSFILGLFSVAAYAFNLDARFSLLIAVGFCGSFTTMSSFALETTNLLDNNRFGLVALNVLSNVGLSLAGIISGRVIGSLLVEQIFQRN
jgi:CrcB protein